MTRDGLYIGEVAARSRTTPKALRLYERAGIVPAPRRTTAGYRLYAGDTLALLDFVAQARRLGFTLAEIKEIVAIKRAGRLPCAHVRELVRRKLDDLDRRLADLAELRRALHGLLRSDRGKRQPAAVVCPHIVRGNVSKTKHDTNRRSVDGQRKSVPVPALHELPGSRDRR